MLLQPLNEKVALLPAFGIGDGLIMTTIAHLFQKKGFGCDLFHPKIHELSSWFPHTSFLLPPKEYELCHLLKSYAWIFVQNDNSSKVKELLWGREQGLLPQLCIFYVTHKEKKHGPLHPQDYLCDLSKTILENTICAANRLLLCNSRSKETGLSVPNHLQKGRFAKRILLHPLSGSMDKNWTKKKYLLLAQKLQERGFDPVITVGPQERSFWTESTDFGIDLPLFPSLHDFASFLYESKALIGNDSFAGHLSSLFALPTLIIASKKKQMDLWQPGWKKAKLVFPPSWIPNWKPFRLLEKRWQLFISVRQVLDTFSQTLADNK